MTATEPGRYIARPVVTEAIQWDGSEECLGAIARWAEDALVTVSVEGQLCVDSPEGAMLARPGDWIIRGVPGEYYPREPDTFDSAYRPAPQGSAAGLTDPDAAYLRRIADLLPGKHSDRARNIARHVELFLTCVEDAIWVVDQSHIAPEQRLSEVRELLAQCLVAEDTRAEIETEDGNPPTTDRLQALATFQTAVTACTLGLDGDALATVLSQAQQTAETAASSQRHLRA